MEDKDIPDIFNGKQEIMLFQAEDNPALTTPLDAVVADSLTIISEEEDAQEDYNKITKGTWSFSFSLGKMKRKDKVIFRWLIFGGRKPYSIKYPHKPRRIRVLSKWINRYMHAYNYEK